MYGDPCAKKMNLPKKNLNNNNSHNQSKNGQHLKRIFKGFSMLMLTYHKLNTIDRSYHCS